MTEKARTVAEAGEAAVIALFAGTDRPPSEVIVANGDDAAVWRAKDGRAIVATTDALVEGVHFDLSFGDPHAAGRKLLAVNLSDLAAMGSEPRYALISVCFPAATLFDVAAQIAAGALEMAREHGVYVAGGNVARSRGGIVLSATLIGEVDPKNVLRRIGSVTGDAIFVTGALGDAAAGLILAQRKAGTSDHSSAALIRAQLDPSPRVQAGLALAATNLVHAACDISDGLGRDLRRLLAPIGLGARVDRDTLPISADLQRHAQALGIDPHHTACAGGEDYELLFTAAESDAAELERACAASGTQLRKIGVVLSERRFELVSAEHGPAVLPDGFDHFPTS